MKRIVLIGWMAGAALGVTAAEDAPATPAAAAKPGNDGASAAGPRIEFATPIHDFGKITAGQIVTNMFVFSNTGSAALEIKDVRPGCGCTTAGGWDKTVAPGKTGNIPIQFNAGSFSGNVTKSINVTCNDPARSNVVLQLKANIWTPISITPASVYFSILDESPTNETKIVKILNNLDEPVTLSAPTLTNNAFRAELKTITEGKEYALHVTPNPAAITRTSSAQIELKTSSDKAPTVKVMASAMVQQAITVLPQTMMVPTGPSSNAITPSVTIRNTSPTPLVLSEPAINLEGVNLEISEVQTGKVFRVSLKLPPNFTMPQGKQVEATFKSNNPKFPVIKVPVVTMNRPTPLPARQLRPRPAGQPPVLTLPQAPTITPPLAPPQTTAPKQ